MALRATIIRQEEAIKSLAAIAQQNEVEQVLVWALESICRFNKEQMDFEHDLVGRDLTDQERGVQRPSQGSDTADGEQSIKKSETSDTPMLRGGRATTHGRLMEGKQEMRDWMKERLDLFMTEEDCKNEFYTEMRQLAEEG